MRSGIAAYVIHMRSEIERTGSQKEEERPSVLNHRESGKSLVKAIANSSPLLAYDLSKCIQFVSVNKQPLT